MKNIVKKLIESIVIALSITFFSSCRTNYDPYGLVVSGDFIYATNYKCFQGKEGEISIVGLSEEGKQKEILIFPNYIDGHKVVAYGAEYGYKWTGLIEIPSAKKIYFCTLDITASPKYNAGFNYLFEGTIELFIGSKDLYDYITHRSKTINYIDDSIPYYYKNNRLYYLNSQGYDYIGSTISYYTDEETCYFVDYVVNDKVSVIPPVPYREGYEFDGWYSDLSYTTKWDFNNIINPTPKEIEFEGDFDYSSVKVYAKWKEII